MEKLELKHLAPYLPYGLNVLHTEKNKMLIISGVYLKVIQINTLYTNFLIGI